MIALMLINCNHVASIAINGPGNSFKDYKSYLSVLV
jgi:hypothetical protein